MCKKETMLKYAQEEARGERERRMRGFVSQSEQGQKKAKMRGLKQTIKINERMLDGPKRDAKFKNKM